jgi:hypothetical protein
VPDLSTQSAADNQPELEEWQRHGFESKAEMDQAVYQLMNEQSKERIKRRQALYEMGFLTTDQFYNNR